MSIKPWYSQLEMAEKKPFYFCEFGILVQCGFSGLETGIVYTVRDISGFIFNVELNASGRCIE